MQTTFSLYTGEGTAGISKEEIKYNSRPMVYNPNNSLPDPETRDGSLIQLKAIIHFVSYALM